MADRTDAGPGRPNSRQIVLMVVALAAAAAVPTMADRSEGATSAEQRAPILAPATDFTVPEPDEELSGGAATNSARFDRDAFSQPAANLSPVDQAGFFVGNGLFRKLWVPAPASTTASDGLGPLYNARACQLCHLRDGRGHPPEGPGDDAVSMFLRLSIPPQTDAQRRLIATRRAAAIPEPVYGRQLQDLAIRGHMAEGRLKVSYEEVPFRFPDGETASLRKPVYDVADRGYGPLHRDVMLSPRVAPPVIGLGLLEAIAERDLLAHADPEDRDGDGISGRPNIVWSKVGGRAMPGRFGWKAGTATLAGQNAAAMAGDIGIANRLAPDLWGDCTEAQKTCRTAPHGDSERHGGLEADDKVMDLILFYTRTLAVPARRNVAAREVLRGKKAFYEAGCIACHVPKFVTAGNYPVDALAGQLIWPYADLLLHDMGDGLADGRPEGAATGREWRTPPLWGIGMTETVSGHSQFLHDGRARNLTEAILWHDGEAEAAKQTFVRLTREKRAALIAFLKSL